MLLNLVGGENLLACIPAVTTFSGKLKPNVKYAVSPPL